MTEFEDASSGGGERSDFVLKETVNAIDLNDIECIDLRRIADVWLGLPREEGEVLPRWSSFSPSMITPQLNKVCILHVGNDREVEFSLYGGHATERIGNGQPLVLQKLPDDPLRRANYYDIRARAVRAVEEAAPQYAKKTLGWDGLPDVRYELLMLPFHPENGFSRVMQPLTSEPRPLN